MDSIHGTNVYISASGMSSVEALQAHHSMGMLFDFVFFSALYYGSARINGIQDAVISNHFETLTTVPSILPGSQAHHPPGWNQNWEWRASSARGQGMHWWDTNGGEWRWHSADKWHPYGHWDYNPWGTWNSAWTNIPEVRISPPVAP